MKKHEFIKYAKKSMTHPLMIISAMNYYGLLKWLPDKTLLEIDFKARHGKKLDLDNPVTYNEKLQWLKLYDRDPVYSQMVDKYEVYQYVSKKIGKKYLIPLLGVWDSADDIEFDKLPDQFVLKPTHDSGCCVICTDKETFSRNKAIKKLNAALHRNYYYSGREWPYKDVKPRVIAQKYIVDESGYELKDYKIFCFDGVPKLIHVDFNRFTDNHQRNIYTPSWEYVPMSILYPTSPETKVEKPVVLKEMLTIAKNLSAGIPHVRVDLYVVGEKIYFGELTFYHDSGHTTFNPPEWDETMGSWIRLPGKVRTAN
ncbi:ATP-grasp fold amidoligase family protein [Methanosarcina mazei]|uniref:Glycosyl transferase n=5 Tax=Methanosarcina mazei TaxID=2209 RepID=A0A4P8R4Q4_METMZ|nr:ATP-grasp fold amidoligase family protein [Methanosarcina mazei]AKB60514.1 Glycosyltransferase [Methanosarcina mazei SarPi]QCR17490.1 glycosyl transferase [Methanosarcina mazei]QIB90110.1 glycosyl transferase [Methanosarcina mazei]UWJ21921.1 Glycosyltransferase [Methanosarcina mazei TMA]BBL66702.1 glycosyl transferase [Methanosarcina mazei]